MALSEYVSGLGWQRDLPDFRDYTPDRPVVNEMLGRLKGSKRREPRRRVDLREFFAETVPKDSLPIPTAHACVALAEYFDRRTQGRITRGSALFLHQMARKLSRPEGRSGTDIRTALKAMARFGLPPERYWPSEMSRLGDNPDAALYRLGEAFHSMRYFRLDSRNSNGSQTLNTVKSFLAAGFPCVFGFSAPESASDEADILFNPVWESVREGYAAVAVGYDDRRMAATRGALLIRCSVGIAWNSPGYRWLPYAYVEEQVAVDFWSVLRDDWLDSGELQRPSLPSSGGKQAPRTTSGPDRSEE